MMLPHFLDNNGSFGIGWTMYLYLVLLPGFLVCLLLCINKIGFTQLVDFLQNQFTSRLPLEMNLSTFMVSISAMGCWMSFSGMQRYQARIGLDKVSLQGNEQTLKMYFFESRNLALSLLGLVLWSMAGRLQSLHRSGQLVQPAAQAPRGLGYRMKFTALALAALAFADIPMCRMTYNFSLAMTVTPAKENLLAQWPPTCQKAMWHSCATDGPQCEDLCKQARDLSQSRLDTMLWARDAHLLGRVGAEYFDEARDVKQGQSRIDQLFKEKTCHRVLQSVDKSNDMINYFCIFAVFVCMLLFISAVGNVFV